MSVTRSIITSLISDAITNLYARYKIKIVKVMRAPVLKYEFETY